MRRMMAMLCGAGLLALTVGCDPVAVATSAGKVAYQTVRGAQADVTPVRLLSGDKLAGYRSIEVGEVTTDVPVIVTPELMGKVRSGLQKGLSGERARKTFPGGKPTMKINVMNRFCKARGTIGGEGRLDWLVTLLDADSGEQLGVVFVEGVSESPLQHGISDMAEENAAQLAKFLGKHSR